MSFPPKPSKKKDDEDFEHFVEMIRPVFLQMQLTDMLKMSPYAKYMKDIVTNKRKISNLEISIMLANYTFKGGTPKKLGDPGVPTIPCSIKRNYVRTEIIFSSISSRVVNSTTPGNLISAAKYLVAK